MTDFKNMNAEQLSESLGLPKDVVIDSKICEVAALFSSLKTDAQRILNFGPVAEHDYQNDLAFIQHGLKFIAENTDKDVSIVAHRLNHIHRISDIDEISKFYNIHVSHVMA